MAKKMTMIQDLLTEAGFTCTTTNRSYSTKACNLAISQGIEVEIAARGRMWRNRVTGTKSTIRANFQGWRCSMYTYKNQRIIPDMVLRVITALIKRDEVKKALTTIPEDGMQLVTCPRCGGSGWFEVWAHVYDGICFQCLGNGQVVQKCKH